MNTIKYPRTFHLPTSLGVTSDDKVMKNLSAFKDVEVVITEKMDGENTTFYRDCLHARSTTYSPHLSRDWVRRAHGQISYLIPKHWRVCGENVYAKHSIGYSNLKSYFYVFSVWDDKNVCLSWDETKMFADDIGFPTVREFYRGPFDLSIINELPSKLDLTEVEGFVVRVTSPFLFDNFSKFVGKWVRKGHVQTDKHWIHSEVIPNGLKI